MKPPLVVLDVIKMFKVFPNNVSIIFTSALSWIKAWKDWKIHYDFGIFKSDYKKNILSIAIEMNRSLKAFKW